MKKYLITLCLLLGIGLVAGAQEQQQVRHWDVNASAGLLGTPTILGAGNGVAQGIGEVLAVIFTFGLYKPHSDYARVDTKSLPAFAVQGGYQLLPWFKVTMDGFYNYSQSKFYKEKEDALPEKTVRANRVALLPGVKFTYRNRGIFHTYSGIALGAALSFNMNTEADQKGFSNVSPHFAWQITPVGFAIGNTVYGYLDLGLGTEYTGIRLGAGYKF